MVTLVSLPTGTTPVARPLQLTLFLSITKKVNGDPEIPKDT